MQGDTACRTVDPTPRVVLLLAVGLFLPVGLSLSVGLSIDGAPPGPLLAEADRPSIPRHARANSQADTPTVERRSTSSRPSPRIPPPPICRNGAWAGRQIGAAAGPGWAAVLGSYQA